MGKVEYSVRSGFHIYGSAQEIGEALEDLRTEDGDLYPKDVVEAARDPQSPLHGEFEWDDTKAAQKYRLHQARYMIRAINVTYIEKEVEIETYSYVSLDGPKDAPYTDIRKVMTVEDKRERFIDQALRELRSWRSRYAHFKELSDVYEAIDAVL